jgi:aspartyl-tRNA(Asn)/glutamyl-tRNA(Gln) amidotransferase subunit C
MPQHPPPPWLSLARYRHTESLLRSPASGFVTFSMPRELSTADIRKVASLARLALRDDEIEPMRASLGAVLTYMERLQSVDTTDVEPLYNVNDGAANLRGDEPGPALATQTLMSIAPAPHEASTHPPFIRVPKVLDESGGA